MVVHRATPTPHLRPDLEGIADLRASAELTAKLLADEHALFAAKFPSCFSQTEFTKIPLSSLVTCSMGEWVDFFGGLGGEALENLYFGCIPDQSLPTLVWTEEEDIPQEILEQMGGCTIGEALFVTYKEVSYFVAHTNWPSTSLHAFVPSDHEFLFLLLIPTEGIDFSS